MSCVPEGGGGENFPFFFSSSFSDFFHVGDEQPTGNTKDHKHRLLPGKWRPITDPSLQITVTDYTEPPVLITNIER